MKTVLFIFMTGLLVLVSSYAGGEILLRLFHPQFCLLGFGFLEPDDILRHRNQPDLRLKWTTSEINGDFFTNSQGFRNKNDVPGKGGKERILFVGDSFTFGFGLKLEEVFTSRLQKKLEQANLDVEVINAGVVGYGTDQEYLLLKQLLPEIKLRLVVINVFVNDPADNLWRALFYLENGLLRQNPPLALSSVMRLRWRWEGNSHLFTFLSNFLRGLVREKQTWERLPSPLNILFAPADVATEHMFTWPLYEVDATFNKTGWYPLLGFDRFYNREFGEKSWNYGWELEKRLIGEISELLRQNGVEPLFVLLPEREQAKSKNTIYDEFQKNMGAILDEQNVPWIDLLPNFSGHQEMYFKTDLHWNALGNEMYASLLFDHLNHHKAFNR